MTSFMMSVISQSFCGVITRSASRSASRAAAAAQGVGFGNLLVLGCPAPVYARERWLVLAGFARDLRRGPINDFARRVLDAIDVVGHDLEAAVRERRVARCQLQRRRIHACRAPSESPLGRSRLGKPKRVM